jgi:hypothetical protein
MQASGSAMMEKTTEEKDRFHYENGLFSGNGKDHSDFDTNWQ